MYESYSDDDSNEFSIRNLKQFLAQNNFKAIKRLGSGSFGDVYLVQNIKTNKLWALKEIRHQRVYTTRHLTDQARIECAILRECRHEHIVEFHKSTLQEKAELFLNLKNLTKFNCIILEYCNGGDLERIIKNGPIEIRMILKWSKEILKGLDYLHEEIRLVHNDIKPENVFVHDDKIKLGDFGISQLIRTHLTVPNKISGSVCYLSFEEVDSSTFSTKSDIWSTACVIYEMVKLEKLFYADQTRSIMRQIENFDRDAKNEKIKFKEIKPLEEIVKNMLEQEPDKRKKAHELIEQLENIEI